MPLVSVIIPAYNAERTILETITSVLRQSFTDFELIVINDGSTDHTLERLESIHDERLRVLTFDNAGLEAARNRGIQHAYGQFISFIDADDLWTGDKLARQLDALRRLPCAGVAYSWTAFIDEEGKFLFAKEPVYVEGHVFTSLLVDNFIASGSNVLIRRECVESIGLFDPCFRGYGDWDYFLRASVHWPFVMVPRYQILYRLSLQSMSSTVDVLEEAMIAVVQKALQAAAPHLWHRQGEYLATVKQYVAFAYLARSVVPNWRRMAGRKLWESIHLYPRMLLKRKTHNLLWTWLFASLVPPQSAHRLVRNLLRLYGRYTMLARPELRGAFRTRNQTSFLSKPVPFPLIRKRDILNRRSKK
jgi:glycosyltransferase involved in cell wall biosynthesis